MTEFMKVRWYIKMNNGNQASTDVAIQRIVHVIIGCLQPPITYTYQVRFKEANKSSTEWSIFRHTVEHLYGEKDHFNGNNIDYTRKYDIENKPRQGTLFFFFSPENVYWIIIYCAWVTIQSNQIISCSWGKSQVFSRTDYFNGNNICYSRKYQLIQH